MYHHVAKRQPSVASETQAPSVLEAPTITLAKSKQAELKQGNVTPLPVLPGQKLRQAREKRGVSLDEVAVSLNISKRFLEAVELDDYDSLPGILYARGYMKNYCRYLNISSGEIISLFNDLVRDEGEEALVEARSAGVRVSLIQRWRSLNIQWHLYALICCAAVMTVIGMWPSAPVDEPGAGVEVNDFDETSFLQGQLPEESISTPPAQSGAVLKKPSGHASS